MCAKVTTTDGDRGERAVLSFDDDAGADAGRVERKIFKGKGKNGNFFQFGKFWNGEKGGEKGSTSFGEHRRKLAVNLNVFALL